MDRRSTNLTGYTHFGGDVTAQVNSSHGVRLTGGSTGGIVEAVGDDTNVTLTLRGQGAGGVVIPTPTLTLGTAGAFLSGISTAVTIASTGLELVLNSSATQVGSASTTGIAMIQRYRIDWTVPALSSAGLDASFGDSTITLVGATTNSIFLFQERANLNSTNSTGLFVSRVRCSTADELRITVANGGASTISGSTMSGYLLQFKF